MLPIGTTFDKAAIVKPINFVSTKQFLSLSPVDAACHTLKYVYIAGLHMAILFLQPRSSQSLLCVIFDCAVHMVHVNF